MVDTPTNNFCTLNPLMKSYQTPTYYEGNTQTSASNSGWNSIFGSIQISTGKWYWENYYDSSNNYWSGVILMDNQDHDYVDAHSNDGCVIVSGTSKRTDGTNTSWSGFSSGDIIGSALDMDSGTLYTYINGTLAVTQDLTASNKWGKPAVPLNAIYYTYRLHLNFGQDSSFAGNKTAQGNQDGGGIGDFYYTPPSGFLALCTKNLPDPAVIPSEHFDVALRTGTGSGQTVTTSIPSDIGMVWDKCRNAAIHHYVWDVLRGTTLTLNTDTTNAEANMSTVSASFSGSDITFGNNSDIAQSGRTYASWVWKANGTGVSNTSGSITSTVSANADAGFSIVSYTGTGSNATVGHGLSSAPEMLIVKNRDTAGESWNVYHSDLGGNDKFLELSSTGAAQTNSNRWNNTAPTTSVFSVGVAGVTNQNTKKLIAYCFHSVDGYSKVGSYTGNFSTDGTFIYLGFKPAYFLCKNIAQIEGWEVWDGTREPYNLMTKKLSPDTSGAEWTTSTTHYAIDFLSNGVKLRTTYSAVNNNAQTFIYLAFAESPFKHTNAR
jgi:hypothetical protein